MRRSLLALLAGLLLTIGAMAAEPMAIAVESAEAGLDEFTGQPLVNVRWSAEGQRAFALFTADHVGKRVDLMVGKEVVTSPVVQTVLDMRDIQITGLVSLAEARDIAGRLTGKKARLFVRLARD